MESLPFLLRRKAVNCISNMSV